MTVPPGRAPAGWWRQLAPRQPLRLWFVEWLVHRMEVLARCSRLAALDPLHRVLLDGLRLAPSSPDQVSARLGVEPALAARLLTELADDGLASGEGGAWSPTNLGRAALVRGEFTRITFERRAFYLRNDPPTFLPLTGQGQPVALPETPPAPLRELRACADRPLAWKHRAGFPEEVEAILDLTAAVPASVEPWMRVPVDRPERLTAAAALCADGSLPVFAVRADTWALSPEPILTLSAESGAELRSSEPDASAWRSAWVEWARSVRGVTAAEADSATTERTDHRLLVTIPPALRDRLRVARSEAFRGEIWLLAGDASTREAAQLEVQSP